MPRLLRFEECELDLDRVVLRRRGQPQRVEPQVFDVLAFLVRHRDRVVTKEELLDEVWRHRFVTDSAVSSRIRSARKAIGDDGTAQRLIRTVHGRGYQFVGDVSEAEEPAPRSAGAGATASVPLPPTPTVGREDDIEQVLVALKEARLVTLLGPGGVGKTRLALEVALRFAGRTGSTTAFVDLTTARSVEEVPDVVASELGVHVGAARDARSALAEALRGRSSLLVLDNFEHVVEAAGIVADLLGWGPGVTVLVTSRARLRVAGERVVDVAPLGVEGVDDSAVRLFEQAASAVDPNFSLADCLEDVQAICRAVDGLPLAIELAASHVRTLPPVLLRTRIGAVLASPESSRRDAPSRQQTVPAMIDWSLTLLRPSQRRLFVRLGVFASAMPLDAIEAVCGDDVLRDLGVLVDQSLVRRVGDDAVGVRFGLLELLRERAEQLLSTSGEEEVLRTRHAAYVAAFLEDLEQRRWGEASDRWIDVISGMLAEVRAAHAWATAAGDVELAARITASLGTYWHREGHHEDGRAWVARALEHEREFDDRLVAQLHLAAGFVVWPHDQRVAGEHWARAIEIFRSLGDRRYLAYALGLSSGPYIGDDDRYEEGISLCEEAIELARDVGDLPLVAQALNIKGEIARVHGDDDVALAAYEEGEAVARAAGDEAHRSVFLANLSYLADHRGDFEGALRLGCDALRLSWSLGRRMMAAWTISELAGPYLGLGQPERAARLIGAGESALTVLGAVRHPGDISEHERVLAGLRAVLGDEELDRLRADGGRLSLEDAVGLACGPPGTG